MSGCLTANSLNLDWISLNPQGRTPSSLIYKTYNNCLASTKCKRQFFTTNSSIQEVKRSHRLSNQFYWSVFQLPFSPVLTDHLCCFPCIIKSDQLKKSKSICLTFSGVYPLTLLTFFQALASKQRFCWPFLPNQEGRSPPFFCPPLFYLAIQTQTFLECCSTWRLERRSLCIQKSNFQGPSLPGFPKLATRWGNWVKAKTALLHGDAVCTQVIWFRAFKSCISWLHPIPLSSSS